VTLSNLCKRRSLVHQVVVVNLVKRLLVRWLSRLKLDALIFSTSMKFKPNIQLTIMNQWTLYSLKNVLNTTVSLELWKHNSKLSKKPLSVRLSCPKTSKRWVTPFTITRSHLIGARQKVSSLWNHSLLGNKTCSKESNSSANGLRKAHPLATGFQDSSSLKLSSLQRCKTLLESTSLQLMSSNSTSRLSMSTLWTRLLRNLKMVSTPTVCS